VHPTHAALGQFRLDGAPLRGSLGALAAQWRGAVGQRFPDDPAFHGHEGAKTLTRYPEVHYRWVDGAPCVYAFGEAAQRAMAHPWPGASVRLGDELRTVREVAWCTSSLTHSFSRRLVRYTLGAPWIALNQENHARFRRLDEPARRAELDRILVGNLLTMSQAFGWFFGADEVVYAAFEARDEVTCVVKDVPHIGFAGSFVTNLALPDHLAVGRSVSHGFGWFTRTTPEAP
jgi:hypothetical protein